MIYRVLKSHERGDGAGIDWPKYAEFDNQRDAIQCVLAAEKKEPDISFVIFDGFNNRVPVHPSNQWEFHARRIDDIESNRMVFVVFIENASTVHALARLYLRMHNQYDSIKVIHRHYDGSILAIEDIT